MPKQVAFNDKMVAEIIDAASPCSWSEYVHMVVKRALDEHKASQKNQLDLSHKTIEQLTIEQIQKSTSKIIA